MSNPRRSRLGRPYRRLKRWSRHTPNGTMALNMISAGVALIFIAVVLAIIVF
ncbi:MAG: hypothetical protein ACR2LF_11305 [Jatrophihabitantaceae bacterium]